MSISFIKIKEHETLGSINLTFNTLAILGTEIDERSNLTIQYLKDFYPNTVELIYKNKSDSYLVNNLSDLKVNKLKEMLYTKINESTIDNILLECTSLGYVEILTVMNILANIGTELHVQILYAEPIGYKSIEQGLLQEDYALSEEYEKHKYIKPFIFKEPHDTISKEAATLVTFLGFEEERLGRIIEENTYDHKYNEFIYLIAVPGFQFGWENISLSKHNHLLHNTQELFYTPADNPYETYKVLERITENIHPKKIVIMPIGTKPCAIGASIFLVNQKKNIEENNLIDQLATKYDFPIKSKNRTFGISRIYEYILKID